MRREWVACGLTLSVVVVLMACQRTEAPLPVPAPAVPQAEPPGAESGLEDPLTSAPGTPAPQVAQPEATPPPAPSGSPSRETPSAAELPTPPELLEPQPGPEAGTPAGSALDLDALEARLRQSEVLGFFTKLSLKNEIDDLLDEVRAYHVQGLGTLDALEERFDLLVMKVLTLLQDDDPALAEEVSRSREALWALLSDPEAVALLTKETG